MGNSKQPFETTVQNLLHRCNVMASSNHVRNTLQQHPDYPSTLAIVETLPEWGVNSEGVSGTVNDLTEVDYPSIVQMAPSPEVFEEFEKRNIKIPFGDEYVVLESMDFGKVTLLFASTGRMELSIEDFSKIWSGVLIRALPNKDAQEKEYKKHQRQERHASMKDSLLLIGLPTLALMSFAFTFAAVGQSAVLWSLSAIKAIGLAVCTIMAAGSGRHDGLLSSLCPLGAFVNCQRVMASPAGKILGIPMADIGIVYFAGGLLALLLSVGVGGVTGVLVYLGILSLLALPYTVFSIVYQGAVLKSWCWLCLVVQVLFWLEFVLLFDRLINLPSTWTTALTTSGAISLFLGLGFAALSWTALKSILQNSRKAEDLANEVIRLRSNPENIKSELNGSERSDLGTFPLELVHGNPNAQVNITSIVNPLCGHCGHSITEIINIVERGKGAIKATIRFLVMAKPENNTKVEQKLDYEVSRIVLSLVAIGEPKTAFTALRAWFVSEDSSTAGKFDNWRNNYEPETDNSSMEKAKSVLDGQLKWALENKIMSTPTTFINGVLLPGRIQLTDLKYFFIRTFTQDDTVR